MAAKVRQSRTLSPLPLVSVCFHFAFTWHRFHRQSRALAIPASPSIAPPASSSRPMRTSRVCRRGDRRRCRACADGGGINFADSCKDDLAASLGSGVSGSGIKVLSFCDRRSSCLARGRGQKQSCHRMTTLFSHPVSLPGLTLSFCDRVVFPLLAVRRRRWLFACCASAAVAAEPPGCCRCPRRDRRRRGRRRRGRRVAGAGLAMTAVDKGLQISAKVFSGVPDSSAAFPPPVPQSRFPA